MYNIVKNSIAFASVALAALLPPTAGFASSVEHKILHFNGPEFQTSCAKWAIYDLPEVHGFNIKMVQHKDCIGHAYNFMNHAFFLTASGPEPDEAVKRMLVAAMASAAGACGIALAATPSPEPGARAAACYASAKVAFSAGVSASALTSQYTLGLTQRNWW